MNRHVLGIIIVLVDTIVFGLPLTALFAAFVLWFRPDWFREFIIYLYHNVD